MNRLEGLGCNVTLQPVDQPAARPKGKIANYPILYAFEAVFFEGLSSGAWRRTVRSEVVACQLRVSLSIRCL